MSYLKPKTDCFAYEETITGPGDCKALNDLYCRRGEPCPFYKPKKEQEKGEKKRWQCW